MRVYVDEMFSKMSTISMMIDDGAVYMYIQTEYPELHVHSELTPTVTGFNCLDSSLI